MKERGESGRDRHPGGAVVCADRLGRLLHQIRRSLGGVEARLGLRAALVLRHLCGGVLRVGGAEVLDDGRLLDVAGGPVRTGGSRERRGGGERADRQRTGQGACEGGAGQHKAASSSVGVHGSIAAGAMRSRLAGSLIQRVLRLAQHRRDRRQPLGRRVAVQAVPAVQLHQVADGEPVRELGAVRAAQRRAAVEQRPLAACGEHVGRGLGRRDPLGRADRVLLPPARGGGARTARDPSPRSPRPPRTRPRRPTSAAPGGSAR